MDVNCIGNLDLTERFLDKFYGPYLTTKKGLPSKLEQDKFDEMQTCVQDWEVLGHATNFTADMNAAAVAGAAMKTVPTLAKKSAAVKASAAAKVQKHFPHPLGPGLLIRESLDEVSFLRGNPDNAKLFVKEKTIAIQKHLGDHDDVGNDNGNVSNVANSSQRGNSVFAKAKAKAKAALTGAQNTSRKKTRTGKKSDKKEKSGKTTSTKSKTAAKSSASTSSSSSASQGSSQGGATSAKGWNQLLENPGEKNSDSEEIDSSSDEDAAAPGDISGDQKKRKSNKVTSTLRKGLRFYRNGRQKHSWFQGICEDGTFQSMPSAPIRSDGEEADEDFRSGMGNMGVADNIMNADSSDGEGAFTEAVLNRRQHDEHFVEACSMLEPGTTLAEGPLSNNTIQTKNTKSKPKPNSKMSASIMISKNSSTTFLKTVRTDPAAFTIVDLVNKTKNKRWTPTEFLGLAALKRPAGLQIRQHIMPPHSRLLAKKTEPKSTLRIDGRGARVSLITRNVRKNDDKVSSASKLKGGGPVKTVLNLLETGVSGPSVSSSSSSSSNVGSGMQNIRGETSPEKQARGSAAVLASSKNNSPKSSNRKTKPDSPLLSPTLIQTQKQKLEQKAAKIRRHLMSHKNDYRPKIRVTKSRRLVNSFQTIYVASGLGQLKELSTKYRRALLAMETGLYERENTTSTANSKKSGASAKNGAAAKAAPSLATTDAMNAVSDHLRDFAARRKCLIEDYYAGRKDYFTGAFKDLAMNEMDDEYVQEDFQRAPKDWRWSNPKGKAKGEFLTYPRFKRYEEMVLRNKRERKSLIEHSKKLEEQLQEFKLGLGEIGIQSNADASLSSAQDVIMADAPGISMEDEGLNDEKNNVEEGSNINIDMNLDDDTEGLKADISPRQKSNPGHKNFYEDLQTLLDRNPDREMAAKFLHFGADDRFFSFSFGGRDELSGAIGMDDRLEREDFYDFYLDELMQRNQSIYAMPRFGESRYGFHKRFSKRSDGTLYEYLPAKEKYSQTILESLGRQKISQLAFDHQTRQCSSIVSQTFVNFRENAFYENDYQREYFAACYKLSNACLIKGMQLQASVFRDLPCFLVSAVCPGWCRTQLGTEQATRSAKEGADSICEGI